MTKISCALHCKRCGWWSGYDSTKEGVKHIDTICCVCSARLRHSPRSRNPAHHPYGRGGHNKSRSVIAVEKTKQGRGKIRASELNRDKMLRQAGLDGVNPERDGWPIDLFD